MITKQVWLKTLLAIILSVCIAFYVNQFFTSLSEQVDVVVAAEDIPAKTEIKANMLQIVKVGRDDRSKLAPNAMTNVQEAIGTVAIAPLKKGEVLQSDTGKLSVTEQLNGLPVSSDSALPKSFFIPPDQRAVSLKLDGEGSLGFSLLQGDKVDVILTSVNGELGGIFSKTILRNISIFELSEVSDKDRESGNALITQSVTLLVSPDQAEVLALAKRKGKIDLVLTPMNPDTRNWRLNKPVYPHDLTSQEVLSN